MDRIDWSEIDEKELDAFHRRLALVETLTDGSIEETERAQVRHGYLREHGVRSSGRHEPVVAGVDVVPDCAEHDQHRNRGRRRARSQDSKQFGR